MDSVSEARLQLVCPDLSYAVHKMATMLELEKIAFRVVQGLRSWNEQWALYAKGRSTPGPIVTDARPGYGWHEFGLAVDCAPMDPLPDWNIKHPAWKRLLAVGVSCGLVEGALFRSFPDNPHFQLTGKFPATPNDEVRQIFKDGGMQAVWQEAFA